MSSRNKKRLIIKGPVRDILKFFGSIGERNRRIRKGSVKAPREGRVMEIAEALHPEVQRLSISKRREAGPSAYVFTLTPAESGGRISPFRAGAYLSVSVEIETGVFIRRPYSICNSPDEAYQANAYDICVKSGKEAFIPGIILDSWKIGSKVTVSDPRGEFSYEGLRDGVHLVFAAGGSGITPFRALAADILNNERDTDITLIHGAADIEELLFDDDFRKLEKNFPDRFHRISVISGKIADSDSAAAEGRDLREGFIDASVLSDAIGTTAKSLFVCGPPAMHDYIKKEITSLEYPPVRIRKEDYGMSGSPRREDSHIVAVLEFGKTRTLDANLGETVLVALERAGLEPPSSCRNGSCGYCRSRLVEGEVAYEGSQSALRKADRELGFFHPCVAMPRSDMIIELAVIPVKEEDTDIKMEEEDGTRS